MKNTTYCYFNGDFLKYENLNFHISDLQFQRGYGVFDYFLCRNGSIHWLEDYTDRFFRSKEIAGIELKMNRGEFISVISALQEKNNLPNAAFKVILTGGYSDTLESVTGPANLFVLNLLRNPPPQESYEKGIRLVSDRYVRPNPEAKSLFYFNSLRLQKKIKDGGASEVLYYTDTITEASRANLFFVKDGRVSTPASGILYGITRKQVLSLYPGIHVEDIPFENLYDFDEIFLTSTSREVTPVIAVDGRMIGNGSPGDVTREIRRMFLESLVLK